MSDDASPAASSPMTSTHPNGVPARDSQSHREADASPSSSTLQEVCADFHGRVQRFLNTEASDERTRRTQQQTRISIEVIERALRDYDFTIPEISLSYNGGKDCLVLLILYLACLHTHFSSRTSSFPTSIPSIYAKPPDPFPSVSRFVASSSADYHLNLTHISTNPGTQPSTKQARSHTSPPRTDSETVLDAKGEKTAVSTDGQSTNESTTNGRTTIDASNKVVTFRTAFALYLQANPTIKAIFVGTRRTDPHGAHLTHFDMTDGNWPRFMRVHPVIDWHLDEIWCFLRSPELRDRTSGKELEYCTMYDEGYTSLGGVDDTLQNPKLRYVDEDGNEKYKPAYRLTEDGEERLGRE